MVIAVTYCDGEVFQHFGHCEQFKIYETEGKQISQSAIVSAIGSGHGALADFLQDYNVDTLICGGIGQGARIALAEVGIRLFPGVTGTADEQVDRLLDGSLEFNLDTVCNHHHEEGHNCGGGSCGEDKHGCSGN